jgi:hypothetical protein
LSEGLISMNPLFLSMISWTKRRINSMPCPLWLDDGVPPFLSWVLKTNRISTYFRLFRSGSFSSPLLFDHQLISSTNLDPREGCRMSNVLHEGIKNVL